MEQRKQREKGKKKTKPEVRDETPKKLVQPSSSFAKSEDIPVYDDLGKDFAQLINTPLSEGGHFVFKSEKSWTIDVSQYGEFFTLDLKTLSAAINCIPFNECVEVEDRYFTSDQLTNIQNKAENGKKAYERILKELDENNSASAADTKKLVDNKVDSVFDKDINLAEDIKHLQLLSTVPTSQNEKIDNEEEEDLDFLLSLKESVQPSLVMTTPIMPTSHSKDINIQSQSIPTKPTDLEKWLDSVLDD